MASLNLRNFSTLVQNFAAGVQGVAASLIDFSPGSVLRAVAEATSAVVLWLEAQIQYVLTLTRASTSSGPDLDTWMADYGVVRLGADAATGLVTFSRFTNTAQALVPVGTVVQTLDGTQQFTVVADTTNSAYSAPLGGFVIPAGVSSLAVLVSAVNASSASNVVAGAITVITTAIPFVDTVTNAGAFGGGSDPESDSALRARFLLFIASLAKATKTAVGAAITGLQLGLEYTLTENQDFNGAYDPGYFYVVVDDGTGSPPSSLLDEVFLAVDAVRAVGVRFGVFAPAVVTANISMIVTVTAGYDGPTIKGLVGQVVTTYVNTLVVGASLSYSRLAQVAFDASPGVQNVTALLLNGSTTDISVTPKNVIKAGTVAVS
jgi:uncharacterized phage protein gp47/JayE